MRASEFKARCLQAMDEVASTGEPIVITKRGKAIAQLAPIAVKPKTLRGFLKGHVKSIGNIVGPIGVPWDAERS